MVIIVIISIILFFILFRRHKRAYEITPTEIKFDIFFFSQRLETTLNDNDVEMKRTSALIGETLTNIKVEEKLGVGNFGKFIFSIFLIKNNKFFIFYFLFFN